MKQQLQEITQNAIKSIESSQDLSNLDLIRIEFLGKKGKVTTLLKSLGNLSPEERPEAGQIINQAKAAIQSAIQLKKEALSEAALQTQLSNQSIDITLPGRKHAGLGSLHPVTKVRLRIEAYFRSLGFEVLSGPEIETDYYNFEALNIPGNHPARAMHDTFYFDSEHLLRTHTSPMQIRAMEKKAPPFRFIGPGRVYRCDSDITHTPMFHQVEGLFVDRHVTFAHLKQILEDFLAYLFETKVALRFRPSYFPFTEPSAEVDVSCVHCQKDQTCRICKGSGWLEILGSGMVHPNVLKAVNIDPECYSGWAFGMGIDRLAMLLYGIKDLRMLFEHDLRFLKQF